MWCPFACSLVGSRRDSRGGPCRRLRRAEPATCTTPRDVTDADAAAVGTAVSVVSVGRDLESVCGRSDGRLPVERVRPKPLGNAVTDVPSRKTRRLPSRLILETLDELVDEVKARVTLHDIVS